jgi:acetyl-CoA C-acetyltransferase
MVAKNNTPGRAVYVVDGSRTPFLKARGKPGPFLASDLAVSCGRDLLLRQPFEPKDLGEVVIGCAMPTENEANIGRIISLRLGCGKNVPAFTVQRNCASGLQALDCATQDIAMGRHDLVLAGGAESMSNGPLIFNNDMVNWLADLNGAKDIGSKLKTIARFRPHYLKPIIALICGLTDPIVGLNMGQTAEIVAYRYGITREQQDAFAVQSHLRLANAYDKGFMKEVETLFDSKGKFYTEDNGMRRDSTIEKLATLKPFFDRPFGSVTAANSSQVTDGSALLLLASADAVKKYNLPVLGRIIDTEWAGVDPSVMGLGPAKAIPHLLRRNQLTAKDIDYWEINEAFAAQVLGCLAAWKDPEFCKEELESDTHFGEIPMDRLNVDGGAIACGHPVGASGARITLHLLNILKRQQARFGVASLCIGGGQGGAILIEHVDGV